MLLDFPNNPFITNNNRPKNNKVDDIVNKDNRSEGYPYETLFCDELSALRCEIHM